MRAEDLAYDELLELDPTSGIIRFAGQRALLLDAVAMGLLRKYLVSNFGHVGARTVLTQFGFSHGWRLAEALQGKLPWENEEQWRRAGPQLYALGGLFRIDPNSEGPLAREGVLLSDSYEAEQHLLHFGRAKHPVCWTICGLISGYLSRISDEEIFVLEDRCVGKGDAACRMVGRSRHGWGAAHAEELVFFEGKTLREGLELSLQQLMESLETTEKELSERRRALVRVVKDPDVIESQGLVAKSDAMRRLLELAQRVAKVDSTVLITGESGTGKERIARLVHQESSRSTGPFVAINCGAITESLLESELFGHVRGAFTGATTDRAGLFEAANGGTLLLDEIGEVSPAMQVRLLRALQEREVRRVGDNKARRIDVRILAATNRDLMQQVEAGAFRQDLYYRLKVVELHVPGLRDRRADILPLARLLLGEAVLRMQREVAGLTPAVADQLLRYRWPGNVRELENAMECAVALARGQRIELEDLPEEVRQACPAPLPLAGVVRPLEEIEKEYILTALDINGGNQTHTAHQLHIGTATLYRKLKGYGRVGARTARVPAD